MSNDFSDVDDEFESNHDSAIPDNDTLVNKKLKVRRDLEQRLDELRRSRKFGDDYYDESDDDDDDADETEQERDYDDDD